MAYGVSFAMDEKKLHHHSKNKKTGGRHHLTHTISGWQTRGYTIKYVYNKV